MLIRDRIRHIRDIRTIKDFSPHSPRLETLLGHPKVEEQDKGCFWETISTVLGHQGEVGIASRRLDPLLRLRDQALYPDSPIQFLIILTSTLRIMYLTVTLSQTIARIFHPRHTFKLKLHKHSRSLMSKSMESVLQVKLLLVIKHLFSQLHHSMIASFENDLSFTNYKS